MCQTGLSGRYPIDLADTTRGPATARRELDRVPGPRRCTARQGDLAADSDAVPLSMCGICGSVGVSDEGLVTTMTRLMAHRGPDGEGIRCFPSIDGSQPAALGHRRL